jgi:hypothetical protein
MSGTYRGPLSGDGNRVLVLRRYANPAAPDAIPQGQERPRQGAEAARREREKVRKDLQDARGARSTVLSMPSDKWAANFTSSKVDMLRSIDQRIDKLRKQLLLALGDA